MANIIQADDRNIKRDRGIRTFWFFFTPALLALVGGLLVAGLLKTFISLANISLIGFVIGAAAGLIGFLSIKHYFVVQNETTGMLITINQLRTLFQGKDKKSAFVIYGPGTHLSLPWEVREAKNNIPVTETTEEYVFTAICTDGTLTGKGSFRLRPDFNNPINYLSGVGAVAGDLKDLIISFINGWLAKRTMQDALDKQDELNQALHDEFIKDDHKTPFEDRFGIQLGDITVSQLLMSEEAQRTRSGLNEARVVLEGTAILLGYKTTDEMHAALLLKAINQDDIDRARRDFRIISGNMEGATVNRYELDIKGLSPEVASAIGAFLNTPAGRSLAGNTGRGPNTKPQGRNQT
jgi:hypothetical protein